MHVYVFVLAMNEYFQGFVWHSLSLEKKRCFEKICYNILIIFGILRDDISLLVVERPVYVAFYSDSYCRHLCIIVYISLFLRFQEKKVLEYDAQDVIPGKVLSISIVKIATTKEKIHKIV